MVDERTGRGDAALVDRLRQVRSDVDDAARAAGREPSEVTLVAVSKLHPAGKVRVLAEAGHRDFGESYIQEALAKQDDLEAQDFSGKSEICWHFIGGLQSNKARFLPGRFALVHSLDSLKLAQTLHKRLSASPGPVEGSGRGDREEAGCGRGELPPGSHSSRPLDVLIQVNLAGETQKCGVEEQHLPELAEALAGMDTLRLRGLMLMPPLCGAEEARRWFARLREVRDGLERRLGAALPELSMGMSGDFAEAVAEGATLVRVGTDIFGAREPRR